MTSKFIDMSSTKKISYSGSCIYCKSSNARMTNEHVVPESLGGKFELLKSSCSNCSTITSRFERFVAQRMWDVLRKKAGVKGKKKKRASYSKFLLIKKGGKWAKSLVADDEEFPLAIMFPDINGPRILENSYGERSDVIEFQMVARFSQDDLDVLRERRGADRLEVQAMRINTRIFAMMLMKIGHSFAISQLGTDGFISILDKIWRSEREYELDHLVGGYFRNIENNSFQHPANIEIVHLNGKKFVTVVLSLFSDYGGPYYRIVVGFLKSSLILTPFKRLKVIGGIPTSLRVSTRSPTIVTSGAWSYMCGRCDNIVIQGCDGTLLKPIECNLCGAVCIIGAYGGQFGLGDRDSRRQIARLEKFSKQSAVHACVHGLGSGIIIHFVSPAERNDSEQFSYIIHSNEANLEQSESNIR